MKCYVALDVGNVLCRVDIRRITVAISKYVNLSGWEIGHRLNRYQRLTDVGLVTMTEILESEFGIKSSMILEHLLEVWNNDVVKFNSEMFDFFNKLSDQCDLNIALLSNVGTDHSTVIDSAIKNIYNSKVFLEAIRYYSCNVGVRKPQSLYYQSFIQQYPDFKGCVYLDDCAANLQESAKFGFKAIEFNLEKMTDVSIPLEVIKNLILETNNIN